ncbi:MAG: hypothetical protein ACRCT8_07935 [Lacipirellulaceae bacterium]
MNDRRTPLRPSSRWSFGLLVALAIAGGARDAAALSNLFQQNFDGLQLRTPVQETWPFPNAFTHSVPAGWDREVRAPGIGNSQVGIFEWEGWSLANKSFWTTVAGPGRNLFTLGQGTIAVADPDRWNDLGNPADNLGFYNTLLQTPPISLRTLTDDRLKVVFDSSWRGGCCDDGNAFDPGGNNQTAILYAVLPTGQRLQLLRWESAPFLTTAGRPSLTPTSIPNPFYKANNASERIAIDLTPLLGPSFASSDDEGGVLAGAAMTPSQIALEFVMEDAGDDGWWAIDSVNVQSFTTLLGDMDLSGALDEADVDAFALGMLDEDAYRFTYAGEFPVSHGSIDSVFDFDDIPWFTNLMESSGAVPAAAQALAQALAPVPEPTSLVLLLGALLVPPPRRPTP